MLRTEFNKYLQTFSCIGVIGFWKIGSNIAAHLRGMHVRKVRVYDLNPSLMMIAASQDFEVGTKELIKSGCQVIFCATGNHAINSNDLNTLGQKEVFIASCTSPDNEFDLVGVKGPNFMKENKPYDLYEYSLEDNQTRKVYMLAHGEASRPNGEGFAFFV